MSICLDVASPSAPSLPSTYTRAARLDRIGCYGVDLMCQVRPKSQDLDGIDFDSISLPLAAIRRGEGLPPHLIRGEGLGRPAASARLKTRKWRRISLKTLETDSEMADPTPSLTRDEVLVMAARLGCDARPENPAQTLEMVDSAPGVSAPVTAIGSSAAGAVDDRVYKPLGAGDRPENPPQDPEKIDSAPGISTLVYKPAQSSVKFVNVRLTRNGMAAS